MEDPAHWDTLTASLDACLPSLEQHVELSWKFLVTEQVVIDKEHGHQFLLDAWRRDSDNQASLTREFGMPPPGGSQALRIAQEITAASLRGPRAEEKDPWAAKARERFTAWLRGNL